MIRRLIPLLGVIAGLASCGPAASDTSVGAWVGDIKLCAYTVERVSRGESQDLRRERLAELRSLLDGN